MNATHGPAGPDGDEIEWQVLTQGDGDLDAISHQIGNHLPESLITFVFCVMPQDGGKRMPERFITVQEAAEQLQVHPQTVRVWLRAGKLRGRLIGGRKSGYRIPASEIERLLSRVRASQAPYG